MSYVGKGLLHGSYIHNSFSGDGSTVNFTLSTSPGSAYALLVMVDNVLQSPSAFSVSGTTLTFTSAPASGTNNIRVWIMGRELDIGKPAAGTVGSSEMENGRLSPSRAFLSNTQPDATGGGSTVADTVSTYPFNTEEDPDGIVSLSSGDFTLQAGTYFIDGWFDQYRSGVGNLWLYNVTDDTIDMIGNWGYSGATDVGHGRGNIMGEFTIATQKTFRIRYYTSLSQATTGLGTYGSNGYANVFGKMMIEKVV